ncbi:MAG: hypothetical protein M5U09_19705 [Gammaproteobacteria bacterium]|nr:hypothetical protein [Gammaproteobacteria bacterium]
MWLFGAPIVLALAWLAALEWRAEGVARDFSRGADPGAGYASLMVPLMEAPRRGAARALMAHDPGGEPADAALAKSSNFARSTPRHGSTARASSASAATTNSPPPTPPTHRPCGRQIPESPGMSPTCTSRPADPARPLDALRAYWQLNPGDARQVLSLANLVAPNHDALYRAIVPGADIPDSARRLLPDTVSAPRPRHSQRPHGHRRLEQRPGAAATVPGIRAALHRLR